MVALRADLFAKAQLFGTWDYSLPEVGKALTPVGRHVVFL